MSTTEKRLSGKNAPTTGGSNQPRQRNLAVLSSSLDGPQGQRHLVIVCSHGSGSNLRIIRPLPPCMESGDGAGEWCAQDQTTRRLIKQWCAINDANYGGDGSSDAGDASTGGNNMRNQDSSRCNTACSRVEQQIQKLHALQRWLDSAPRQPDPARREVVTDTFSYF
jgi:hypothetical protein